MRKTLERRSRYGTTTERAEKSDVSRDILTLAQAAALLQIHPLTLSIWRRDRKAPPALNLAGSDRAVRFLRSDVLKWAAAQKRSNTQKRDTGAVFK